MIGQVFWGQFTTWNRVEVIKIISSTPEFTDFKWAQLISVA